MKRVILKPNFKPINVLEMYLEKTIQKNINTQL